MYFLHQIENCSESYHSYMTEKAASSHNKTSRMIVDIFQGTGFIEASLIFTAYYPSFLGNINFPIALVFTISCFICYSISFVYAVSRLGQFLRRKYRMDTDSRLKTSTVVFTSWDWSVTDPQSVKSQKKFLKIAFLDIICQNNNLKLDRSNKYKIYLKIKQTFLSVCIFVIIIYSWTVVYAIAEFQMEFKHDINHGETNQTSPVIDHFMNFMEFILQAVYDDSSEDYYENIKGACLFVVQALVTILLLIINGVAPVILGFIAKFENRSESDALILLTLRLVVLQFSSVAVIFHAQLNNKNMNSCPDKDPCWEAEIGQQIYALMMFKPIIWLILTIIEIILFLIFQLCPAKFVKMMCSQKLDVPGHALQILNLQTLSWVGVIVAPLIPLATMVILILYLILLTIHTALFCKPNITTHDTTALKHMFVVGYALSFSFVFTSVFYMLSAVPPSKGCSPFRGLSSSLDVFQYYSCQLDNNLLR